MVDFPGLYGHKCTYYMMYVSDMHKLLFCMYLYLQRIEAAHILKYKVF